MGSIQQFIRKRKELGHITAARFNVSMTLFGWNDIDLLEDDSIEFSLASIDLPTVRGNYEQVYFDTMPVEVFKNFTYDPDFSMTVICDNEGKIYKQFLKLIQHDKENIVGQSGAFNIKYEGNFDFKQKVDPDISLTVTALGDRDTKSGQMHFGTANMTSETGMIFKLAGVYIKNVGNLSFSNTGSEIITFSVNAAATSFDVISKEDNGAVFSNGIYAVQKMFSPLATIASMLEATTAGPGKGGAGNNDGMEQANDVPIMPEDESYENFRDQNPDIVNEESAWGPVEQETQLPTDTSNSMKETQESTEFTGGTAALYKEGTNTVDRRIKGEENPFGQSDIDETINTPPPEETPSPESVQIPKQTEAKQPEVKQVEVPTVPSVATQQPAEAKPVESTPPIAKNPVESDETEVIPPKNQAASHNPEPIDLTTGKNYNESTSEIVKVGANQQKLNDNNTTQTTLKPVNRESGSSNENLSKSTLSHREIKNGASLYDNYFNDKSTIGVKQLINDNNGNTIGTLTRTENGVHRYETKLDGKNYTAILIDGEKDGIILATKYRIYDESGKEIYGFSKIGKSVKSLAEMARTAAMEYKLPTDNGEK